MKDIFFVRPGAIHTTITTTTTEKEPSVTSCEPKEVSDSINESSANAKSLQKLEKKMKAIQELKLKRSQGVKLEANQVHNLYIY